MSKLPVFNFSLLHPRYWGIWIGIILLYLLVLLPYSILYRLGTKIGRIAMLFMKYRVKIARRNIQLCFPDISTEKLEIFLQHNFESVGMGVIETGIAWFWPEWRIKRLVNIKGLDNIKQALKKKKGILLIGIHFLTMELGVRIFGIKNAGIGVYRPNNNPLLDWMQTWGRLRSNKYMLNRTDIKNIIYELKKGAIIWYAPDHDYGPKCSVFVPFFSVSHAATTSGTCRLIRITKSVVIPYIFRRINKNKKYELSILPDEKDIPLNDDFIATAYVNKIIERIILMAPDQYMWLHRRFKTRPYGTASFYK